MGNGDRIGVMGLAGRRAAAIVMVATSLQACVSGLHTAEKRDYVEESPILIGENRPVEIPRRQMDRYRCASGRILQCSGSSDAVATCICSSSPTLPWAPL